MKKKLGIGIFLLISTALVFSAKKISAQETVRAFTISPPAIEASLNPGDKTEGTLKIINDSPSSLTFTVTLQDFIVKDEQGTPDILPPDTLSNKYSGASWIAVYPSTITVAPHKSEILNYYIQVPSYARPGGHYAAVIYNPASVVAVSGTGTSVQTSIGTLFYVTVKGPVSQNASVTQFSAPGFMEYGPAPITTKITNYSDIHVKPKSKITLTNIFGGKSDEVFLPQYNIFPEVARAYESKLGKGFMIGPYKAVLEGTYGTASLPLSATLTFWIFPWRLFLFAIFMIIAIVVGYRYWKRRNIPQSQQN